MAIVDVIGLITIGVMVSFSFHLLHCKFSNMKKVVLIFSSNV